MRVAHQAPEIPHRGCRVLALRVTIARAKQFGWLLLFRACLPEVGNRATATRDLRRAPGRENKHHHSRFAPKHEPSCATRSHPLTVSPHLRDSLHGRK